jgi:hypothetical protein
LSLEDRVRAEHWYRDRLAWRFIALAYLPPLAALNLLWEMVQLPLYTIWQDAGIGDIVFAVVHCTPDQAMEMAMDSVIAVSVGLAYTVLSEWMNTAAKKWLILPPPALVLARLLARQP